MVRGMEVRDADEADAEAIARIYNHYIATSTVTFDTEPKSRTDRERWLSDRAPHHPVLVAERDGVVLGFGALSPWASRPGWRYTAEVAVYLAPEHTGNGVGVQLLERLVAGARMSSLRALVAQIVSDNTRSIAMMERAGFETVGTLMQVGHKFDTWLDVVLLELVVASAESGE